MSQSRQVKLKNFELDLGLAKTLELLNEIKAKCLIVTAKRSTYIGQIKLKNVLKNKQPLILIVAKLLLPLESKHCS